MLIYNVNTLILKEGNVMAWSCEEERLAHLNFWIDELDRLKHNPTYREDLKGEEREKEIEEAQRRIKQCQVTEKQAEAPKSLMERIRRKFKK